MFYMVHPGGPKMTRSKKIWVRKRKKLTASWHVLSEYVDMTGPCVLFVLDEIRKKSMKDGKITTGEGLEWGILFGFEPHTQRE